MNIFVCLIISIGIIITLWLMGNLIEWICDILNIDTFEFVALAIIVSVLTLWIYTLTN